MYKIQTVIFSFLVGLSFAQAQEDCASIMSNNVGIKKELTEINEALLSKADSIEALKLQIDYYKETLDLLNAKYKTLDKEVEFLVTSIVGNSSTGKIEVQGILINKGIVRSMQGKWVKAIDPKGNGATTYKVLLADESLLNSVLNDIPIKFTLALDEFKVGTPLIRLLTIDFYSRVGFKSDPIQAVFENLKIEWK